MYPPLHDNNLDRLSREAAEQFEVGPGTFGWEHLESRLDQELPQKKDRRRFLFWLFFITVSTGGALSAILTHHSPATSLASNAVQIASTPADNTTDDNTLPNNTIKSDGHAITNNNQNTTAPSNTIAQATPPATGNTPAGSVAGGNNATQPGAEYNTQQTGSTVTVTHLPANQTTTALTPANSKTLNSKDITGNKKTIQAAPFTISNKQQIYRHNNLGTTTQAGSRVKSNTNRVKQSRSNRHDDNTANDQLASNPSTPPATNKTAAAGNDNNDVAATTPTTSTEANTTAQNINSPSNTPPAAVPDKPAVTQPAAADSAQKPATQQPIKKDNHKNTPPVTQHWEIGLVAGPDASTVAFGPLYKPGYNFGVQIGYRFSNRWSVNAGAIYTKKFYKADSQYYHPKYTTPPAWSEPDHLDGNCSMWEIPVNIRYDVAYNQKRRWFVSTGLSTYLMDKENYTLYYKRGNGTYYPYPWSSDTNSQYVFSIFNLSLGIERSLGTHFSLQAEPYLKVPLTGLGHGDMRMDSYGMYITLKYKPTFRSKHKTGSN